MPPLTRVAENGTVPAAGLDGSRPDLDGAGRAPTDSSGAGSFSGPRGRGHAGLPVSVRNPEVDDAAGGYRAWRPTAVHPRYDPCR